MKMNIMRIGVGVFIYVDLKLSNGKVQAEEVTDHTHHCWSLQNCPEGEGRNTCTLF